jgi:hypothetical protein
MIAVHSHAECVTPAKPENEDPRAALQATASRRRRRHFQAPRVSNPPAAPSLALARPLYCRPWPASSSCSSPSSLPPPRRSSPRRATATPVRCEQNLPRGQARPAERVWGGGGLLVAYGEACGPPAQPAAPRPCLLFVRPRAFMGAIRGGEEAPPPPARCPAAWHLPSGSLWLSSALPGGPSCLLSLL